MAGINQGVPETAIGEPIRLGSNNEFEIEQHPVSDRLIIRDTVNGKVAYVRKERGGQIGGDGVLIEALKQGKPMADDGRTYDTIQEAERQASSWVFVPPGTFNESVEIATDGLTLRGSGYNTLIDGSTRSAINGYAENLDISNLSLQNTRVDGSSPALDVSEDGALIDSVTIRDSDDRGIDTGGASESIIVNCVVEDANGNAYKVTGGQTIISSCYVKSPSSSQRFPHGITIANDSIVANCVIQSATTTNADKGDGIAFNFTQNSIAIGNQVFDAERNGIGTQSTDENHIIANNRVSGSGGSDISTKGTGTILDSNLTGVRN